MHRNDIIGLLGALIAAITVEFNDQVFSVALPDVLGGLGVSSDPGTWLDSLYATGQVIGMALSTSLAISFSIRRFALFIFVVDTAASLVIPFSGNLGVLFGLRLVQGLCGGFIIPLLLTVGIRVLPPHTRLYALAAYALTATVAPNMAPAVAALWVDVVSWRFVFFENVPLFTVAFLLVWYGLPQDPPHYARLKQFDWTGALLIIIAAFSLVTLLEQGNRLDWFNSRLICVLALLSLVTIPLFIFNELNVPLPLFGIRLLRRRNFAYGLTALFSFIVISQSGGVLPASFLQQVSGFRPIQIYPLSLETAAVELVMLPLVAMLLNRPWADARVVSSLGLLLIMGANLGDSLINGYWVTPDFQLWQLATAVGQPMFTISLLMMSTNTIRDPRDGPFAAAMINSVRAVGEPVGLWLIQLVERWRGALHAGRIADQMGQTRFDVIQAPGLIAGDLPPLLPNGQPRFPDALEALQASLQTQATVMSLGDAFIVFTCITVLLLALVWLLAERTYPPRILFAQKS